jgi:hypothetical protein
MSEILFFVISLPLWLNTKYMEGEENEIRIISIRQAIKKSQELVRRYVSQGRRLSEELIRERRGEHIA